MQLKLPYIVHWHSTKVEHPTCFGFRHSVLSNQRVPANHDFYEAIQLQVPEFISYMGYHGDHMAQHRKGSSEQVQERGIGVARAELLRI